MERPRVPYLQRPFLVDKVVKTVLNVVVALLGSHLSWAESGLESGGLNIVEKWLPAPEGVLGAHPILMVIGLALII